MKKSFKILIILILFSSSIYSQIVNKIEGVDFTLPCKLNIVYNQGSVKEYNCKSYINKMPVSYLISVEDLPNSYLSYNNSTKKVYRDSFLNNIFKKSPQQGHKNVKYIDLYNLKAVQFDTFVNNGNLIVQSRSIFFIYKGKSFTLHYFSTPKNFDFYFDNFLKKIKLY